MKGQTTVLFAVILVVFLALVALVVDGGIYYSHWQGLQADLDVACVIAANHPTTYVAAFNGSLAANGVQEQRSIVTAVRGFKAEAWGPHQFYLAQFMGLRSMDVHVYSRCLSPRMAAVPIAMDERCIPVKSCMVLGNLLTFKSSVTNFGGGAVTQLWCGAADCSAPTFFAPITAKSSSGYLKKATQDTIAGALLSPLVPIGQYDAVVVGTSNKDLVTELAKRYSAGWTIMVLLFNEPMDKPGPKDANKFENVLITGYARVLIEKVDANTLYVTTQQVYRSYASASADLYARVIPWDWSE